MPGIVGLISPRPPDECRRLVERMLDSMRHENYYTSGSYSEPNLGVFAGWVALKGSFSDRQPILSEREDVALLLSGECFSDPDTRARLHQAGHRFGADDAGWLAHFYEERGSEFFADLNGVFGGLLIDRRQRRAFLFNDRYGMERIYYHAGSDAFFFASEAKALLRVLPELRAFDEEGLVQFLQYGCTLGWRSLFRGVELLPGASAWSFTGDTCARAQYFTPSVWESQGHATPESFQAQLNETFSRVVPRYLGGAADDVGISLTGGLDTRMIMACRPPGGPELVSYTFAGVAGAPLDVRLAARVASVCRIPHHVLRIGADFFSDFASLADRTVYMTDGSFGVCGAHEIYLNHQARGLSSVRLTGNFGSEILRGTTTFRPLGLLTDLFEGNLRHRMPEQDILAIERKTHPVSFAAFKEIPWHLFGVVRAANSQICTRTPYLDNDIVALAFRAPEDLRASSSPALRLVGHYSSRLGRIPTDRGLVPASRFFSLVNWLWYRASFKLDYWYHERLPRWLSFLDCPGLQVWPIGSHKYLPYRRWFRAELAAYVEDRLMDLTACRNHLWNPTVLARIARDHKDGRTNNLREINAVLTLEAIDRLLFHQP
jgi:asparagine synthase (glutamine-hydrolysing)